MRKETAIFLFVLGLLAFNWPLLRIFDSVLPSYIFLAWLVFILIHMVLGRTPRGS